MVGNELTEKQKELFDYIVSYVEESGFPPTREEIAKHFNLKQKASVIHQLQALEKKGFIKIINKVARGIEIIKSVVSGVPMLGEIAAGSGLLAEENILGTWDPIRNGDIPKQTFALKVCGESMIGAGIFPDDIVLVDPNDKPNDGDIGAVLVDGEATIKHLFFGDGTLTLEPANDMMQKRVIETDYSTINVLGSVIAVWRPIKSKRNV